MAYRDEHDLRIGHLQQLVAAEPEHKRERMKVRHACDRLAERVDALGIELAAKERSWLADDDDKRAVADELAKVSAELASLVAREREIDGKLAEIASGREELARLEAAAVRAMAGPSGQLLRELEGKLAKTQEWISLLDPVLSIAERAERLATALVEMVQDQSADVALVVDGVVRDRATRIEEHAEATLALLRDLAARIGSLREHDHWRGDDTLELLHRQLLDEDVPSLENGPMRAVRILSTVLSRLGKQYLALQRERDRIVAERAAVIASAI